MQWHHVLRRLENQKYLANDAITFFFGGLMHLEMFSYWQEEKTWAQSLGHRDFGVSFTSKSGAISP